MRVIYKYTLLLLDINEIRLPLKSYVVKFLPQHNQPNIWVMVDPDETKSNIRKYIIAGTGQPIPNNYVYIDSYQNDYFVWHLFEVV